MNGLGQWYGLAIPHFCWCQDGYLRVGPLAQSTPEKQVLPEVILILVSNVAVL